MGNDIKRNPKELSEKEIAMLEHKTDLSKRQILQWHTEFIVSVFFNNTIYNPKSWIN